MKRLCLFCILLFAATAAHAQALLYITSYNDTGQIVYLCNGATENSIPVQFAMLNLNSAQPILIDSIVPHSTSPAFQQLTPTLDTFTLTDVMTGTDALYFPTSEGDDTIYQTAYYDGKDSMTAAIIFHAHRSANLSMFGYTLTNAYLMDGNGFGGINQTEVVDTMYDKMPFSGLSYYLQSGHFNNGGEGGQAVELRSCGGATIDSIYENGDFSEFAFDPFPTLPYTIPGDDSLIINFEFTPLVLDETGSRHHYLIFHSTDGHYLVWSFKYKVYPSSSVTPIGGTANGLRVFPNPATDKLQIIGGPSGTARLFDLLGRECAEASDNGSGAAMDVSRLEAGAYFLRIGGKSAEVEIAH